MKIGFSTGKHSLVSMLIRKLTGSKVSHAFIIFYDQLLKDELIMEADVGGFQIYPLSKFIKNNTIIAKIDVGDITNGLREASKWLGEAYDYEGLFSGIIMMLGRWLGKKWKNPFHKAHSMFCSEAVVRVLQVDGLPLGIRGFIPWDTTPQDLYNFLLIN